jgi:cytoskeletal protein RodZ
MLNLSDKELDRLSKEAAQEYDPGDVLGPRSWERLEVRLDNTPGGLNPNPLRHIRRFPFYYAPALLVLIGVSYYFVKQGTRGSGSPPTFGMAKTSAPVEKNASNTTNPVYPDKSTPAPSTSVNSSTPDASASGGAGQSAAAAATGTSAAGSSASGSSATETSASRPSASGSSATVTSASRPSASGASTSGTSASGKSPSGTSTSGTSGTSAAGAAASDLSAPGANTNAARYLAGSKTGAGSGRNRPPASNNHNRTAGHNAAPGQTGLADGNGANVTGNVAGTNAANAAAINTSNSGSPSRELNRSSIGGLASTKKMAPIPDSNLRKFTLKSLPHGMPPRAMYVNRNLQIGFILAPDFTSVNSLAGNRPGSTVGLSLDYQFSPHWYISSGLLLDRKNYAARAQDYHAPTDFYQNNVFARHLDYVKGTFEMLEIPLNLRYDFSVSGSTLFFASAGVSSYLMTTENSGMYGDPWGQQSYQPWAVPGQHNFLFAAANLSLGVETGLSNSLSLLIAPYMKIPTRGMGYGQVQMSSVGINFALKFAPVISRKRK